MKTLSKLTGLMLLIFSMNVFAAGQLTFTLTPHYPMEYAYVGAPGKLNLVRCWYQSGPTLHAPIYMAFHYDTDQGYQLPNPGHAYRQVNNVPEDKYDHLLIKIDSSSVKHSELVMCQYE